jgi:large subunit ribosomal protein L9
MKVILFEENRIAEVSPGHARNFLFPKKLAVPATPENLVKFEKKMKEKEAELLRLKEEAQALARKLEATELIIKAEAGEEDKLFGTVTTQDVVQAVSEQFSVELDRRKVNLNEHIKKLGEYSASVKLHHAITAHIKIKVEKK